MSQSNTIFWKAMGIAFLIQFPLTLIGWFALMVVSGWWWLDHWYVRAPINTIILLFIYVKMATRMLKKQQQTKGI